MLDRSHRFHGYNALNFAHKQGSIVRGSAVSIKFALNQRRQTYRVAVVVSKKVAKSAVTRNRIRRRVFELVRHEATKITNPKPYDIIFMIYSADVAIMDSAALQQLVANQLQKTGVFTSVNS